MEQKQPHEASGLVVQEGRSDVPVLAHGTLSGADERPAPGHWLGTNASILNVVERLKAAIDEETESLKRRASVDFDAFGRRKNRGLLELTRAMRMSQGLETDPRVASSLSGLRASLLKNQSALRIQLDAVREVSAILARSMQEVESDGTYSSTGLNPCK